MALMNKLKQKMGQMNANRPQMGAPSGGVPAANNRPAGPPQPQGLAKGLNNMAGRMNDVRSRMGQMGIGNRGMGAGVPPAPSGFAPSDNSLRQAPPMENRPPVPDVDPMQFRGQMGQMGMQPGMGMQQPGMNMQRPQMGGMFGGYRNVAQNQQNDMQRLQQMRQQMAMQGQQFGEPSY